MWKWLVKNFNPGQPLIYLNHNITTGNPLIALKLAESCNGMLAEISGQPSRITEDLARSNMMKWRRLFPAICVGAGTVHR